MTVQLVQHGQTLYLSHFFLFFCFINTQQEFLGEGTSPTTDMCISLLLHSSKAKRTQQKPNPFCSPWFYTQFQHPTAAVEVSSEMEY